MPDVIPNKCQIYKLFEVMYIGITYETAETQNTQLSGSKNDKSLQYITIHIVHTV